MLMRVAAVSAMLAHVYAGECNMRLLDSYADTLEHKIWVDSIHETDVIDRLDFMYGLPEIEKEKFSLFDGDYAKYPTFQSFVSLCKKNYGDGNNEVKCAVTALFNATAHKYFSTVNRMERAKKRDQSVCNQISEETVMAFLTADKTKPVMTF